MQSRQRAAAAAINDATGSSTRPVTVAVTQDTDRKPSKRSDVGKDPSEGGAPLAARQSCFTGRWVGGASGTNKEEQ